MKAIGPTFGEELKTAGLFGLAFTWGADGAIAFGGTVTPEQRAAVLAVYDAHDPLAVSPLLQRIAQDETERDTAKIDSAILALVDTTPAGLVAWARNNFPSLTLAEQNRIGVILNILAVAARPHVR